MTATEELRRLLDERGVKWTYGYGTVSYKSDSHWCNAWEHGNGMMCVSMGFFTPEQAIAATLGRGECYDEGDLSDFCCSACGVRMFTDTSDTYTMIARDGRTIIKHPNFCPNCGKKIVDPTTNDVDGEVDA